ncbi:hypothetical protein C5188_20460 [Serratia liquefaciens]|nr:hypothetical protein C5188_20460 [Serratia liquefaciens]
MATWNLIGVRSSARPSDAFRIASFTTPHASVSPSQPYSVKPHCSSRLRFTRSLLFQCGPASRRAW